MVGVCVPMFRNSCKRRFDLENSLYKCTWLWLRLQRLPRPLSGMVICVVYSSPDKSAQEQRDLIQYLVDSVDLVRPSYPDCGVCILGDFNCVNISDITFKQVVKDPTRGRAVQALRGSVIIIIRTSPWNGHLVCVPHVGGHSNVPKKKTYLRRFTESAVNAFGRWVCGHRWFSQIEDSASVDALVESFTGDLSAAIHTFFSYKSCPDSSN